jgi:8-oxo-dGTP diphosphatase
MSLEIAEIYGNKVRIRVCGLCWHEDALLMVKHKMGNQDFWAPPGGGVEFGEPLAEALRREIAEETGLTVLPGKFLFGCEFIQKPLHAVELFFEVQKIAGALKNGNDPEMPIIEMVKFLSPGEIQTIPTGFLHGIFKIAGNVNKLRQMTGFYSI